MRILLDGITKRFGDVTVIEDMNLEIRDGEMLALLGPSGCGKSTTLFAICGIHGVDGGRILFGDEDVTRTPPQARNVSVVFQSYALYPHMTVFKNISFPLEIKHDDKAQIRAKVKEVAHLMHIEPLLDRLPAHLSGGQQQRVALARALVRRPSVLLLDEPLANLDARLRLEMRAEIRRLQLETGITAVLVTHDQVEAMSMSDRIAIMDSGVIHQIASPKDMYDNPVNAFVAAFLGNPPIAFLEGEVSDGRFTTPTRSVAITLPAAMTGLCAGRRIQIGVRPEFVTADPKGEVEAEVAFVETQGRENLYDLKLADGGVLRSIQPARDDIRVGDRLRWRIATEQVMVFDDQGLRL
ncbi:MAG: ABC transporter ATP-binding protein [Woeseiaceae bacterium]